MTEQISPAMYREHVMRAMASHNHFTIRRDYSNAGLMSKNLSLFFQDLVNVASMTRTKKDGDGYFLASVRFLKNGGLKWSQDTQERHLKELTEKGFAKVKFVGKEKARWIILDIFAVETALTNPPDLAKKNQKRSQNFPKRTELGTPSQAHLIRCAKRTELGTKKTNTNVLVLKEGSESRPTAASPPSPNGVLPGKARHSPEKTGYTAHVRMLQEALRRQKRQAVPFNSKLAEHFRLLAEQDGQDYLPILTWFCRHCSVADQEKFRLPGITGPKQFRTNYTWIEGRFLKHHKVVEKTTWERVPVPGKKNLFENVATRTKKYVEIEE